MQTYRAWRYVASAVLALLCVLSASFAEAEFAAATKDSFSGLLGMLAVAIWSLCSWGLVSLNFNLGLKGPEIRKGEIGTVVAIYAPSHQAAYPEPWWHVVIRVPCGKNKYKDVHAKSSIFFEIATKNFTKWVKVGARVIKTADRIALFERDPTHHPAAGEAADV